MSDAGLISCQKSTVAVYVTAYLSYACCRVIKPIVVVLIVVFPWTGIMTPNNTQTGNFLRLLRQSNHDVGTDSAYVDHSIPHHHLTHAQRTLLIAYILVLALWILRRIFYNADSSFKAGDASPSFAPLKSKSDVNLQDLERGLESQTKSGNGETDASKPSAPEAGDPNGSSVLANLGIKESLKDRNSNGGSLTDTESSQGGQRLKFPAGQSAPSTAPPVVSLGQFLDKAVLFGAIMVFFYLSDYYKLLPQADRQYSRDTFLFLVFLIFLVASAFTVKANKDKILNREQTEEWKGWMQVMFVWYHYFRAKEWYNWIRVYIACYVWMTGFGNFSFFWVRKDFSMWRMMKMLFRLNFLVIFVAMVTNNEYMLYYICAMHTYWFLTVYAFMRVLNSWNTDRVKMAAKFAAYAACNALIFDVPGVSQTVFRPVKVILGRHDHSDDVMHEWSFRAGLDHWACFLGMLCAYNYPTVEKWAERLDASSLTSGSRGRVLNVLTRAAIGAAALGAGVVWYFCFMRKEKHDYNVTHAYSSMIPILAFIVLRNLHPVLRSYHLRLFTWLGKITLETYLSQLHIYLLANATSLVDYLPGYPLLNFALATAIYLLVSHALFGITNDTSSFLITKEPKQLALHLACSVALFATAGLLALALSL